MNNPIGVMQGRLLPKYLGRYQAHPVNTWPQEFARAAELGLQCIEFILDFEGAEANPLLREGGIEEILRCVENSGVSVHTVCADYFMEAPLHHPDHDVAAHSQHILMLLLKHGQKLGLTDIVIPCVDQSSFSDRSAQDRFVQVLNSVLEAAEDSRINLSLETDLPPEPFAALLQRFDSKRVTVNYDTGNSAALGYSPGEELACYGDRISDIHIKDRILGGGSVILGSGDTQFDSFFATLTSLNYQGPFILQAYRDDEGLSVFSQQLQWFLTQLQEWLPEVEV